MLKRKLARGYASVNHLNDEYMEEDLAVQVAGKYKHDVTIVEFLIVSDFHDADEIVNNYKGCEHKVIERSEAFGYVIPVVQRTNEEHRYTYMYR